jgi:hypothetical protein
MGTALLFWMESFATRCITLAQTVIGGWLQFLDVCTWYIFALKAKADLTRMMMRLFWNRSITTISMCC